MLLSQQGYIIPDCDTTSVLFVSTQSAKGECCHKILTLRNPSSQSFMSSELFWFSNVLFKAQTVTVCRDLCYGIPFYFWPIFYRAVTPGDRQIICVLFLWSKKNFVLQWWNRTIKYWNIHQVNRGKISCESWWIFAVNLAKMSVKK